MSFRSRLNNKNAMTMIEVLIVVALISMISIAVYTSLASGLRVWKRSQQVILEQDIVFFFEKITQDLRNAFLYSEIQFDGGESQLSFPTIVQSAPDAKGDWVSQEYIDQIGHVEYEFEISKNAVLRREGNYSETLNENSRSPVEILKNVKGLKFRYIYYTDEGEFTSPTVSENPPSAVEVEVRFGDAKGDRVMRKFIDVPVGN